MTIQNELVIVQEGDDAAGATVWWRLRGEVDRERLRHSLDEHRAHYTISPPGSVDPETALRRAVGVLRGKRRLVRPLRRGMWAVVDEEVDASRDVLKHWSGPTITLDKIGRVVVKQPLPSSPADAAIDRATCATLQEDLGKGYDHFMGALTTEDISAWLIANVERLGAVGLRDGGGIYYVPPHGMGALRALTGALAEASQDRHAVYVVPTVRMTRDGARAILDSLTAELDLEMTRVRNDVISGDLGVRALENRAEQTKGLLAKLDQYEALLDRPLASARNMVLNLSADLAAAVLAAEAAAEDAASRAG